MSAITPAVARPSGPGISRIIPSVAPKASPTRLISSLAPPAKSAIPFRAVSMSPDVSLMRSAGSTLASVLLVWTTCPSIALSESLTFLIAALASSTPVMMTRCSTLACAVVMPHPSLPARKPPMPQAPAVAGCLAWPVWPLSLPRPDAAGPAARTDTLTSPDPPPPAPALAPDAARGRADSRTCAAGSAGSCGAGVGRESGQPPRT